MDSEAAAEAKKCKEDAYNEAIKTATAVMNAEFEKVNRIRKDKATMELGKLKKDLGTAAVQDLLILKMWLQEKFEMEMAQTRSETMVNDRKKLEKQVTLYNKQHKKRMKKNNKNFEQFKTRWYIDAVLEGNCQAKLSKNIATRIISTDPEIFARYKELCIRALEKYKVELKAQYQNHLNDIELECQQWLKASFAGNLGATDGIQKTLFQAKAYDHPIVKGDKNGMENPGEQISRDELEQEAKEIMADYETRNQIDSLEGGFRLPHLPTRDENYERELQVCGFRLIDL
jgi:hypothetical protein